MGSLYAKDVISKAQSYIGYHEGPNNDNYFADILDGCGYFTPQKKQFVPWCAVFCDCCCLEAAIPEDRDDDAKKYDAQYFLYQPSYNNYSASANMFASYFINAGAWYGRDPEPGDMIFFKDDDRSIVHVGIVESYDGGIVTTIEGNTSNQVARKQYSNDSPRIAGYGRPRYDGYEQPAGAQDPDDDFIDDPVGDAKKIIKEIKALLDKLDDVLSNC